MESENHRQRKTAIGWQEHLQAFRVRDSKKFHGKGLLRAGLEKSLKIEAAKLRRAGCTSAGGMDGHKNGGGTSFENPITA